MRKGWWKILAIILLVYTLIAGFMVPVPHLPILHETIRNLYFHVPMWFGMIIILTFSVVYSIRYLGTSDLRDDIWAIEAANVGVLLGTLGIATGSLWSAVTWGEWWSNDPKQTGAAIALLIYMAYFVLRNSVPDIEKRAKVAAVYNIFAFATLIPLLFILPSMTDSLHPGAGGNPGFNVYDLDNRMRMVFYPSVFAWTLLGLWIVSLMYRVRVLKFKELEILD
ncbi:MAG: cytochrome c biogenesis protein CcsA [Bacteroidetes bacterium]|nr:cytochrome c biogenesis protein CcsA [Bacteroidota bacterium]